MKTKTKKRLAGAAGILIILGLLLAVDAITGDPFSRAWAQWRALHRAETLYPDQEFYVASSYSGQFFNYGVTVQSTTSTDTRFDVTTDFWLFTEDRAGEQVENRWNTCYRMGQEGAEQIAGILAQEAPELNLAGIYGTDLNRVELDLAWEPDGEGAGRSHPEKTPELFPLDGAFDMSILQKVPSRLCLQVNWTGTPTQENLDTVLHTLKQVMEANGLPVTYYDVHLVPMYSLEEYDQRYSSRENYLNEVLASGPVAANDIA